MFYNCVQVLAYVGFSFDVFPFFLFFLSSFCLPFLSLFGFHIPIICKLLLNILEDARLPELWKMLGKKFQLRSVCSIFQNRNGRDWSDS